MIEWLADRLAVWSVRTYVVIVQLYPHAFQREFGESMTQVFRDQVRETCQDSGLAGLAALWMRTFVDPHAPAAPAGGCGPPQCYAAVPFTIHSPTASITPVMTSSWLAPGRPLTLNE
jgi:hypothetical protein